MTEAITERQLVREMFESKKIIECDSDNEVIAYHFDKLLEKIQPTLVAVKRDVQIIPLGEVMRSINIMTANL